MGYTERQTKTRTGIDSKNVRKVKPKMFVFSTERNPVAAFKKYSEIGPAIMNASAIDSPFYFGINFTKKEDNSKKWFKIVP